jgi:formylglycine-generating enzyme required for sulfatase activity
MSGNVYEWCSDWYGKSYYNSSPGNNPQGPDSGTNRVIRGGCWLYYAENCLVAIRNYWNPDIRYNDMGFRLLSPVE